MDDLFGLLANQDCYTKPSTANLVSAVLLMVGTVVSFFPQYYTLAVRKSVEGLSITSFALGLSSSLAVLSNQGILNWGKVDCCQYIKFSQCMLNNLAGEQLLVVSLCQIALFIMYIAYSKGPPNEKVTAEQFRKKEANKTNSILLFVIIVGIFSLNSILAGVTWYIVKVPGGLMSAWGMILGILASIFVIFQQVPQIILTWKIKSAGSLSLGMLLIQFPGNIGVIGFQAGLNKANITTWGPYLVSAIQILILIIMIVYFKYQDWRLNKKEQKISVELSDISQMSESKKDSFENILLEDSDSDIFEEIPLDQYSDDDDDL